MKLFLKPICAFILLILVLFVSMGDYFVFKTFQNIVYFRAKIIIASSEEEHLNQLYIPLRDFWAGMVRFEKKDEIVYRGNWYDIKKAEIKNDTVILLVYKDEKEKLLVENWLKCFAQKDRTIQTLVLSIFQMKIFYQHKVTCVISLNCRFFKLKQKDRILREIVWVFNRVKPPEVYTWC
ncbi:MAG: hypothetical protein N2Z72_00635 [Bacteroidales bacterium]|nr:hypothetical protein [Bacteroidales bacterium]